MHGIILDIVIDGDHAVAEDLAVNVSSIIAQHEDVKSINITLRCEAEPLTDETSILD